ncbi:MAG TPA: tripartite tricarboxylate transporter TctB family protein, partial [Hyphomicrobiaceae bacterium]|nr:tripartite tricarboxylate transporter TctB family protein [Hyphomicrobiaceae bacterium]
VAGAGLVLSALVILGEAVLRPGAADGDFTGVDVWPVALMSAALLAEAVLIARIGWVPVVTILFATGAWAFGDRRVMSNLLIGFSVGLVVLVAFRFGLGIDLPLGPLAPLLPVTS